MAYCSLCFLDDLDTVKAKELTEKEAPSRVISAPFSNIINLFIILGLNDFNLNLSF